MQATHRNAQTQETYCFIKVKLKVDYHTFYYNIMYLLVIDKLKPTKITKRKVIEQVKRSLTMYGSDWPDADYFENEIFTNNEALAHDLTARLFPDFIKPNQTRKVN